jgi:hypothetical protein
MSYYSAIHVKIGICRDIKPEIAKLINTYDIGRKR